MLFLIQNQFYYLKVKQIKAYLDQLATISEIDWDFFMSKLERRVIPKKTVFLKVNEIENHISFIEFGVVSPLFVYRCNSCQKFQSP